jgi:hypothetical protein
MDDEDTQHLDGPLLGVLMLAALPLAALLAATACAVVIQLPPLELEHAPVKPVATLRQPDVTTTPDGDSNHAQISIQAQRPER